MCLALSATSPAADQASFDVERIARTEPEVAQALSGIDRESIAASHASVGADRWRVTFRVLHPFVQQEVIARADVAGPAPGHVVSVAIAHPGTTHPLRSSIRNGRSGNWKIVGVTSVPLTVLWCLLLLVGFPLRSWRTVDVAGFALVALGDLLMLGFGASTTVNLIIVVAAGWLAARSTLVALGRARLPAMRLPPEISVRAWKIAVATVGATALVGSIVVAVLRPVTTDIGAAGYLGALQLLHGDTIYQGLPAGYAISSHVAAYGPLMYVPYVPVLAIVRQLGLAEPWIATAQTVTIASFLVCLGLLALAIRRWAGATPALLAGAALCLYQPAVGAVQFGQNDFVFLAAVSAALAALQHATLRGALIGIAGMAKVIPFVVAGAFARPAVDGSAKQIARFALGLMAVVVPTLAATWMMGASPAAVMRETLLFHAHREPPGTTWAVLGLQPLRPVIEAVVGLAVIVFMWRLRDATPPKVAAAAAAGTAAIVAVAPVNFGTYVIWVLVPYLLPLCAGSGGGPSKQGDM